MVMTQQEAQRKVAMQMDLLKVQQTYPEFFFVAARIQGTRLKDLLRAVKTAFIKHQEQMRHEPKL